MSESASEDRMDQTAANSDHLVGDILSDDRMSKISQGHLQQTAKIPVL